MSGDIIRDALAASKTPEGIARRIDNIGVVGYVSPSIRKVLDSVARDVRALVPAATRCYLTSAEVAEVYDVRRVTEPIYNGCTLVWLRERYGDVRHEMGRGFYVVGCTGVLDPATGILQHPGETCPVCPNTETEPLEWVEINGGIDRQTDLPGPFYAQIGPEGSGGWSWTILDCDRDGAEVASGRAPNEAEAERAVVAWAAGEGES